jgi:hypothetical protein
MKEVNQLDVSALEIGYTFSIMEFCGRKFEF